MFIMEPRELPPGDSHEVADPGEEQDVDPNGFNDQSFSSVVAQEIQRIGDQTARFLSQLVLGNAQDDAVESEKAERRAEDAPRRERPIRQRGEKPFDGDESAQFGGALRGGLAAVDLSQPCDTGEELSGCTTDGEMFINAVAAENTSHAADGQPDTNDPYQNADALIALKRIKLLYTSDGLQPLAEQYIRNAINSSMQPPAYPGPLQQFSSVRWVQNAMNTGGRGDQFTLRYTPPSSTTGLDGNVYPTGGYVSVYLRLPYGGERQIGTVSGIR
jgi:hypothetical protein